MVPINKIAEELQVHKDYVLRLVKKMAQELGLKPHYGRRNALSLSREDADRLINNYRAKGVSPAASGNDAARPIGFGYFYIIQLHPEDLPTRLKIGYTDNLDVRQSDHRTTTRDPESCRSDVGWAKGSSCPRGLQIRNTWWATLRFCPPYMGRLVVVLAPLH
jgi:hypothetical protein